MTYRTNMNVFKLSRKYPQFKQDEILRLQDAFNRLDGDDKGYLDEATAIKAGQQLENKPYDTVRTALKSVELDSSRRVELEDFVDVRKLIPSFQHQSTKTSNSNGDTADIKTPRFGRSQVCCGFQRPSTTCTGSWTTSFGSNKNGRS